VAVLILSHSTNQGSSIAQKNRAGGPNFVSSSSEVSERNRAERVRGFMLSLKNKITVY